MNNIEIVENKASDAMNKVINDRVLNEMVILNEMHFEVADKKKRQVRYSDEHSIVYGRLKQRLQLDIVKFCLNEIDLRNDLMFFRSMVGDQLSEVDIRKHVRSVQDKFNNGRSFNRQVSVEYFMEATRFDFVLVLFVSIIRGDTIYQTRFVFRFRKTGLNVGVRGMDLTGLPVRK